MNIRKNIKKILAVGAIVSGLAGAVAHQFGLDNILFSRDRDRFINSLVTGNIEDGTKLVIQNTGKTEECQSAMGQWLESFVNEETRVYDWKDIVLGNFINDTNLCLEGLSGIERSRIDEALNSDGVFENGFPVIEGFEIEIVNYGNSRMAYYSQNGNPIASILNLDGTTTRYITPQELRACEMEGCERILFAGNNMALAGDYGDALNQEPLHMTYNQGEVSGLYGETPESLSNVDGVTIYAHNFITNEHYIGPFTDELRLAFETGQIDTAFHSTFNSHVTPETELRNNVETPFGVALHKGKNQAAICSSGEETFLVVTAASNPTVPNNEAMYFMYRAINIIGGTCGHFDDVNTESLLVRNKDEQLSCVTDLPQEGESFSCNIENITMPNNPVFVVEASSEIGELSIPLEGAESYCNLDYLHGDTIQCRDYSNPSNLQELTFRPELECANLDIESVNESFQTEVSAICEGFGIN